MTFTGSKLLLYNSFAYYTTINKLLLYNNIAKFFPATKSKFTEPQFFNMNSFFMNTNHIFFDLVVKFYFSLHDLNIIPRDLTRFHRFQRISVKQLHLFSPVLAKPTLMGALFFFEFLPSDRKTDHKKSMIW